MKATREFIKEKFEEALGPLLDLDKDEKGQYTSWQTMSAYSYFIKGWTLAEQNKVQ